MSKVVNYKIFAKSISDHKWLTVKSHNTLRKPVKFIRRKNTRGNVGVEIQLHPLLFDKPTPRWMRTELIRLSSEIAESSSIPRLTSTKLARYFRYLLQKSPSGNTFPPLFEEYRPVPNIQKIWVSLRMKYFPRRPELDNYEVSWSTRKQTRTLAACNVYYKTVKVAPAMKDPEAALYLEPLLYHELCHAVLGNPKVVNGKRIIHGPDFKALEEIHPAIEPFNDWLNCGGWEDVLKRVYK